MKTFEIIVWMITCLITFFIGWREGFNTGKKYKPIIKTNVDTNKKRNEIKTVIKSNKIKCKKCKDIIESKHRHDFVYCKCGSIAVDGGLDYLRRVGNPNDILEMSEEIIVKQKDNEK